MKSAQAKYSQKYLRSLPYRNLILNCSNPNSISEETKTCVEASLLLSSYALNEQREIADAQMVIMLVKANDVLGNLFYLYDEALTQDNRNENIPDSASMAEAMLKELILNYEAILASTR